MTTLYMIYFTDQDWNARCQTTESLSDALAKAEALRKDGYRFVTMVSENSDLVGKQGAVGVVNGKLPNGDTYEYTKRDALSQRTKKSAPTVGTDNVVVELDDE